MPKRGDREYLKDILISCENIKNKYPDVEWQEIAKTRDKLIHSYFGVDLDVVWDIITEDIPRLQRQIENIIKKEEAEQ